MKTLLHQPILQNRQTKVKRTRKGVPRHSPPQSSSIYRGTDGQGDLKLICGIRIAGMSHRIKKEDKVTYIIFLPYPYMYFFNTSLIDY
ncbi:hypothetical protein DITRI_Ditri19aG0132000 [Diplodiscus trichospermus]